jgi:hypothetical protein
MKKNIFLLFLFLFFYEAKAQQVFTVSIAPSSITAMPPVHSGAFAEWNGKWIFIGGRIEGLHNFQSGLAFTTGGRNDSVFVVDPITNLRWSAYAGSLPVDLFESICSNNMEFYTDSSTLYMIGGFGRQDSITSWTTFPLLTAVDLNGLSNAVINGTNISSYFRQMVDTNLAVAGGQLQKIDSTYYLVFGQKFEGVYTNYNSPLFTQHYTSEIRKFNINDNGTTLSISNYSTIQDTDNFHRRDYNLIPQIFPNHDYGFTAFGGVFQKFANLPYLNPVDISSSSTQLNSTFNQNLNQYETAAIPVYDSLNNFMHTIFFGGMSLYTYDTATMTLVQDTMVPFVKTISKVSRNGAGNLLEYNLPIEMPSLIGSNARFIPDHSISFYYNNILNLNSLSGNTKVGWIVSGIQSDFANVSNLDPGSMSRANTVVYDVYVDKSPANIQHQQIKSSVNNLFVYPNPSHGIFTIEFSVNKKSTVDADVFNTSGKKIASLFKGIISDGKIKLHWDATHAKPGIYFCRIKSVGLSKAVMMVVAEK